MKMEDFMILVMGIICGITLGFDFFYDISKHTNTDNCVVAGFSMAGNMLLECDYNRGDSDAE